jgi:hypothetical protein
MVPAMKRALILVVSCAACGGGGSTGDDQPDAFVPTTDAFGGGPPIEAPDDTWTWVPFPESRCMNDTPTGIGVNWHDSDKVLIYLEGGGACFNLFTCASVAHQNGFGEPQMTQTASDYGSRGIFNRDDDDNPFKDWNYVFVPYCTGDVHAGLNEDGMGGRNMTGYRNIGLYLERLSPTFPAASQVVLTGSSAGGFGAAFNYDRVAKAFGAHRPVFLLDDSGPPMSDTYLTPCLQQTVRDAWHLDDTLPAECTECRGPDGGGMVNLSTFLGRTYPNQRQGLITSNRDGTIRTFFGFGYPDCTNSTPMPEPIFAAGVEELTQIVAPHPSFAAYVIDSTVHVWLLDVTLGTTTSGGVVLTDWLRAFLEGGSDWQTVRP